MGEGLFLENISLTQIRVYYFFVSLTFAYLIFRFRKNNFLLFIILLFYQGLFSFVSKDINNLYKIFLLVISVYYLIRTKSLNPSRNNQFIFISFFFFTLVFLYTSFSNGDYFFIVSSQYSKYFVIFSLFLILSKLQNNRLLKSKIEQVIYLLLLIQTGLSIIKFIVMGPVESIVGSVGSQGGALATTLPIMAFMFLWLIRDGRLGSKDWLIIFGFLFIGFVSLKRAIWFIMPVIVMLFVFYIPRRKIPTKIFLLSLFAVPLIFYFGIRFNPTLNREGRAGGSFNINYAVDYAQEYMFGSNENNKVGTGRGGATFLLIDKLFKEDLDSKDWFGYGLRFMYTTDYKEFDKLNFGISSKGAATGVFQSYVSGGYLGILATILLVISILSKIRNKRLKYVVIGFFSWEYFFYTGIILREYSLTFLLIYIIIYSGKELAHKRTEVISARSPVIRSNTMQIC